MKGGFLPEDQEEKRRHDETVPEPYTALIGGRSIQRRINSGERAKNGTGSKQRSPNKIRQIDRVSRGKTRKKQKDLILKM